jgi:hypothetical protein
MICMVSDRLISKQSWDFAVTTPAGSLGSVTLAGQFSFHGCHTAGSCEDY